jgi:hypothetical protein
LAVTKHGELFSFGNNCEGQLGISRLQDVDRRYQRMKLDEKTMKYGLEAKMKFEYNTLHNDLLQFPTTLIVFFVSRTFCNRIDDLKSTATPTRIQFEVELAASRHPVSFEVLQLSCGSRHCAAIVRTWRMDTHEVFFYFFPASLEKRGALLSVYIESCIE